MIVRLIIGLAMTAAVIPIAARRGMWLYALAMKGQPAPDRVDNAVKDVAATLRRQVIEVFAQKKLLKWSVPGAAHFVVFWAFVILGTVYVEAYGALFDEDFAIPLIGHWAVLGAAQDAIAVLALLGIAVFALIRWQQSPAKLDRKSRFKGSHTGGAWVILAMIFNVLWTMFFFRGAASAAGNLPYENGAEVSIAVGKTMDHLSHDTLEILETVGLMLHIGVMLVFLVIVVYSKHMHIFIAPLNVTFARKPDALGPLLPMQSNGKPLDFEEADPDVDVFGRGKVEDFTWKGFLDFATCTECGRCQSQCPAWNTGKPLSPKMVILDLRDHAFGKAPYLLAGSEEERAALPEDVRAEAGRTLVAPAAEGGVIDPDVLWSCTTCGACVEQCPVDIEHIDHIVDMRRYQVMVESAFPSEAAGLLKNLENKGNPWGMNARARMEWTKDLGFKVPIVGKDVESLAGWTTRRRRPRRPWRSCCTSRTSSSRSWARPRRARATRRGAWARSSSSRCWRPRTSRTSRRRRPPRSSPPARTASTPSAGSTPSSGSSSTSCTTRSCSTSSSRPASSSRRCR
jgi:heterodisulfide reductase subunit C